VTGRKTSGLAEQFGSCPPANGDPDRTSSSGPTCRSSFAANLLTLVTIGGRVFSLVRRTPIPIVVGLAALALIGGLLLLCRRWESVALSRRSPLWA
jgi:hypothetical protein